MRRARPSVQAVGLNLAARTHGYASPQYRSCPLEVVREGTESLRKRTPQSTAREWERSMPYG